MKIIRSIRELREYLNVKKSYDKKVGFVPTMGYLHKGHMELVKRCITENDIVVVSIFVNPTQFGENEDFSEYPRDIKRDKKILSELGTDILFNPENEEMYPEKQLTNIDVSELSDVMCGKSRPGHFNGVATVVTKLFNIVSPDNAYFGQKDAQQLIIIKKMVKDLNLNVKIISVPTVRDKSGLAMSSRNKYLSENQKSIASNLSRLLHDAKRMIIKDGVNDPTVIERYIAENLKKYSIIKIDYIEIRDIKDLKRLKVIDKNSCLIAAAIFIDGVRLIDNVILGEI